MAVYFIRAGENGPVKIGYSADVSKRFTKIATDCPPPAVLLGCIEGGTPDCERELHRRFAAHRLGREWFAPHADLLAFVAELPPVALTKLKEPKYDNALGRWLLETGTPRTAFARAIGCSSATLSRILNEVDRPGWDLLRKIAEVTEGRVMPNDFLWLKGDRA